MPNPSKQAIPHRLRGTKFASELFALIAGIHWF